MAVETTRIPELEKLAGMLNPHSRERPTGTRWDLRSDFVQELESALNEAASALIKLNSVTGRIRTFESQTRGTTAPPGAAINRDVCDAMIRCFTRVLKSEIEALQLARASL